MKTILILCQPLDKTTGARVNIRVGSSPTPEGYGLGNFPWEPAITRRPTMTQQLFDLQMTGKVQVGTANFALALGRVTQYANPQDLHWLDAPITVWSCDDLDWAGRLVEFSGVLRSGTPDAETLDLSVRAETSTALIDVPLLTLTFGGSGGIDGDAALRGTYKPFGAGNCPNVEPIWFDSASNIGMVEGYGNLLTVVRLLEGGAAKPFWGDYASYAALKAAIDTGEVPRGWWATCVVQGLVGLGAPPAGVITCDIACGHGTPGDFIGHVADVFTTLDNSLIDFISFAALDSTLAGMFGGDVPTIHYWIKDQRQVLDLLETTAGACNASLLITLQGMLSVTRMVSGAAPAATLDRTGNSAPRILGWANGDTVPPWWQLKARTNRPGRVLEISEVFYDTTLNDRGDYKADATYQDGDLVWMPDQSQWLYVNASPSAGHQPPAWPTTSDAYWQNTKTPFDTTYISYNGAPLGDTLEQIQQNADAAAANAAAALSQLASIGSDGIITKGHEKNQVWIDYQAVMNENANLSAAATSAGIAAATVNAWNVAYNALKNYMDALSPVISDTTVDTPLTASSPYTAAQTFALRWSNYLNARTTLVNAIAQTALWSNVTGPGKPDDNATRNNYRGAYVAGTTYQKGDEVTDQGAIWLFTGATPSSAYAPPTLPASSNAAWSLYIPAADTSAIQAEIDAIQSDSILSRVEKPTAIRDWRAIANEAGVLQTQANAYGVSHSVYDSAYLALNNYLNGLVPTWDDTSVDNVIDGPTWLAKWQALYVARTDLIKALTDKVNGTATSAASTAAAANSTANSANALASSAQQFATDVADNNKFSADEKKRWYQQINTWNASSSNAGSVAAILQTLTNAGMGSGNSVYNTLNSAWSTFFSLLTQLGYSNFSTTTYTSVGSSKTAFLSTATAFENALKGAANALDNYAATLATAAPSSMIIDPTFVRPTDPLSWVAFDSRIVIEPSNDGRRIRFPPGQGTDMAAQTPYYPVAPTDRIDIEFEYFVYTGTIAGNGEGGSIGVWTNLKNGNDQISGNHPGVTIQVANAKKDGWTKFTGSIYLSSWSSDVQKISFYVQAQPTSGNNCYIRNPKAVRVAQNAFNLGPDGTALSRRLVSPMFGGGVQQVYNVNPLTANTSQIFIAAHTVYDDAGTINYGSGTINGVQPGENYAVYEDTGYVSGSPTYFAVGTAETLTASSKRRLVGTIRIPTSGTSTGGGTIVTRCVAANAILPTGMRADGVLPGALLTILSDDRQEIRNGIIRAVAQAVRPCVEIVTRTGKRLTVSVETEVVYQDGSSSLVTECLGRDLPCMKFGERAPRWETVVELNPKGDLPVVAIDGGGVVYAAGDQPGAWIFTHNKAVTP